MRSAGRRSHRLVQRLGGGQRTPRYTGYVPYYVAKAGVVALAEALALELAADGVQVNAIAPGPILPAAGTTPEDAGRRASRPRRSAAGAARRSSPTR